MRQILLSLFLLICISSIYADSASTNSETLSPKALNFEYLQLQKLKPNDDFTIFGKPSSGVILVVQKSSIQEVTQCDAGSTIEVQALVYLMNSNDENVQQSVMIADCVSNEMAPRSAVLYENFDKEGYGHVTDIYTSPNFCPTQADFDQFNSSGNFKPIAEYICSVSSKS